MFDLRIVVPSSPAMIRAWLIGLVHRILPIDPDPYGWGQPDLSSKAFRTDTTLRPQEVPPEIRDAGGYCVGLEVAFPIGDDQLQPMGPVIAFVVTPIGQDRSEVQIFFPLGLAYDGRHDTRKRLVAEFERAWPDAVASSDSMPWWFVRDFDRRALCESIATRSPAPPGAPARCPRNHPLPWRDAPIQAAPVAAESTSTEEPNAAPVPSSRVRKVLFDANMRLRDDPHFSRQVRVTVEDLAKAAGYTRPYLYEFKGDIDLKPYLDLRGDLPPER